MSSGQRRVGMLLRFKPGLGPALVFDGDMEISGSATIVGECSSVHANGDLLVSGNPIIGGDLSASGTATVSGTPVDTLSNPITAQQGAPPLEVPDLVSTDYCGAPEFIFTSAGLGTKISTSESFGALAKPRLEQGAPPLIRRESSRRCVRALAGLST